MPTANRESSSNGFRDGNSGAGSMRNVLDCVQKPAWPACANSTSRWSAVSRREERDRVTILFGGLTWKHEEMIKAVFRGSGYQCQNMPTPIVADFQAGKEYRKQRPVQPHLLHGREPGAVSAGPRATGAFAPADHRRLCILYGGLLRSVPLRHVRSGISIRPAECGLRWVPRFALPADRRYQGSKRRARA